MQLLRLTAHLRALAIMALPLMAASLAQKGMQFIDTIMMGWLGPEALAAAAIGSATFFTVIVFFSGILSATGISISRALGANDHEGVRDGFRHGMILAAILALPCMGLLYIAPSAFLVFGMNPTLVTNASAFLQGMIWGVPGLLFFLVFREFISAFSKAKIVMLVTFGSLPLVFVANLALMYGKWGLPQLGIAGVGYASAMVMWVMFLCLFLFSKINATLSPFLSLTPFGVQKELLLEMSALGIPSGILLLLESGMFFMAVVLMGHFGQNDLAAYQIALQCGNIIFALPFALSMSTALQVSHALGKKALDDIHIILLTNTLVWMVLSGLIGLAIYCNLHAIAALFMDASEKNNPSFMAQLLSFMALLSIFQLFDGLQTIVNGCLRGLRDTFIPMLCSLACYWVLGIGGGYVFSRVTGLGAMGVWYGLLLGVVSATVILNFRLILTYKQYQRLKIKLC
jgi:MATE family multidrug resistance protein